MSLCLITGTPGSGKSQVCLALQEMGHWACDTDLGPGRWQHNISGNSYAREEVSPEMRTAEFLRDHSMNMPREYIESLTFKSKDATYFICGAMDNENSLLDLFDTVIALRVTKDILRFRLATRTTNDWGKQPQELDESLGRHDAEYIKHERLGSHIIDSSQALEDVVKQILAKTIQTNQIITFPKIPRLST